MKVSSVAEMRELDRSAVEEFGIKADIVGLYLPFIPDKRHLERRRLFLDVSIRGRPVC